MKAAVSKFIDIMGSVLEAGGAKRVAPVSERIAKAVDSGNRHEVRRVFTEAIYDRFAKMSESIPAITQYLDHGDPYVRFTAAETLLIAGRSDGVDTLVEIAKSADPIVIPPGIPGLVGHDQELRREALAALAKFRIPAAIDVATDPARVTGLSALVLLDLARSGLREGQVSLSFIAEDASLTIYGLIGIKKFIPKISAVLESEQPTGGHWATERWNDSQIAASWALAEMTGNDHQVARLAAIAQQAVDWKPKGAPHEPRNYKTRALRYLGSVDHPQAIEVLEAALSSENTLAVKYAVVNLLYNHDGGSGAAREVLIEELRGGRRPLGVTLSRQIAAGLDDPEIHAIAADVDRKSSSSSWRYWGVERKDWPIYNWIDDYVVKLRRDFER